MRGLAFFICMMPLPALAADEVAMDIAFFSAGVLCAPEAVDTRPAPDTVSGTTNVVEGPPEFVSSGRVVPAVLGVGFGTISALEGRSANVTIRVTHPPMGDAGAMSQSFESFIGPDGDPGFQFYQFDYGYELVLGQWTIAAYEGDQMLWSTHWTVVPPAALPELASVCGYTDLLS